MKAIVLAAGYATRLRPLTENMAKPLLPVGGRPMLDYIVDKIAEVDEVDALHVVTNSRYADGFRRWAERVDGRLTPSVHDDGTTSNENRRGAIGDIQFTVEEAGLRGEDLLVIAGDNLFDFSLDEYVDFWRSKGAASCVALFQESDLELVKEYSVVEVDESDRLTSFIEKPENPTTNLVAIATYIYHREHVALVDRYLAEGNSPDQPGNLVAWLYPRAPVYGYRFAGDWRDIGNREQLLEADNAMRERYGLPTRSEYTPD